MLTLIAAMDATRVIGHDNRIPRDLPPDLARFHDLTKGHTVVMGRKTHESIGRSLSDRTNIVISRTYTSSSLPSCQDVLFLHSYDAFVDRYTQPANQDKHIYIIGGQQIYEMFVDHADAIELTVIDTSYQGDTYFPPLAMDIYRQVSYTVIGLDFILYI